jgi:hypothetical protein
MDEVHTLRNKYSADICVLMANYSPTGTCGMTYVIGASSYSDAFCAVNIYCANNVYSFVHEIGHLMGCRHDTYVDSTNTPYAYGHGYTSPAKTWRTIMAYADDCGSCPRLQYWSNPNGGIFYIKNNAVDKISRITIQSMQGVMVQNIADISRNELLIDISHCTPGINFVKIIFENTIKTHKIIKQ